MNDKTLTSNNTTQQSFRNRALLMLGLVASAVVAVILLFITAKATGADLKVTPEFSSSAPKDLPLEEVIAATIALSLLGVLLAWLIGKFLPRPRIVFLAGVVLGLVGYGALAFEKTGVTSDALWLNAMHFAAAVPMISGLLSRHVGYFK